MAKSRGAGAAQRGFDYDVYRKGGKVKKYEEGGGVETRSYASFGDWMGDLFGKKKVPASAMDETTTRAIRETERARPAADEDREIRRPAPTSESLPTAPQRRMQRRRASGTQFLPSDEAVTGPRRSRTPRPMSQAEREAEYPDLSPVSRPRVVGDDAQPTGGSARPNLNPDRYYAERLARGNYMVRDPSLYGTVYPNRSDLDRFKENAERSTGLPRPYAKGGVVKKAGGGSCRGMGAAQRGGKYTIK
jgi:hypothetical protein